MRWRPGRRRVVVAVVTALAVLVGAVVLAWMRRTAPPWPAAAGVAYEIPLGSDGCPAAREQYPFVDTPGLLVPPHPVDVMLCAIATEPGAPRLGDPPRQRVLRTGAHDFAELLNRLPGRNTSWRQHQRRHSGWWPDAAPAPLGEVCPMIGYTYDFAFVLRYPDRPPVPLVFICGGKAGELSSGARTRMDHTKPHVVDEFVRRFEEQQRG